MTTAVIIAIVESLGTYQIPGTILSDIYVLTHLIFTSTLMNQLSPPPYGVKETEGQNGFK